MHRLGAMTSRSAPNAGPEVLDSLVMEPRDRLANLGLFAAAAVVWVLVGFVVTARDPLIDPVAGYIGAALIGLAVGLTIVPLAWLTVYGRHKQIAYRGDWLRAARRATWVGIVVTTLIAMRLEGLLELPLVLFIVAIAFVAEATLSAER